MGALFLIFKAILEATPTPVVRLNPDLPLELERIINRALEKDRNPRYQHASEMRSELMRLKRDTECPEIMDTPPLIFLVRLNQRANAARGFIDGNRTSK